MLYYRHNKAGVPRLVWRREPSDHEHIGIGYNLDAVTCDDCTKVIGPTFFTHTCPAQHRRLTKLAMHIVATGT